MAVLDVTGLVVESDNGGAVGVCCSYTSDTLAAPYANAVCSQCGVFGSFCHVRLDPHASMQQVFVSFAERNWQ